MKDNKFKEAWESSTNIVEVASKINLTPGSVRTTAWRLRKRGVELKFKQCGRPRKIENEK